MLYFLFPFFNVSYVCGCLELQFDNGDHLEQLLNI